MLEQRKKDLAQARRLAEGREQEPVRNPENSTNQPSPEVIHKESTTITTLHASAQWEYQKAYENASNESIDALMAMIGLESVKQRVLEVKDQIDESLRQGADLQKERFSVVLLGNPGTGQASVYRSFLHALTAT